MVVRPCILSPVLSFSDVISLGRNFEAQGGLPQKQTSIALDAHGSIDKWRTEFIFAYDVFPKSIMTFETQWQSEGRDMRVGDVILQRASLPPGRFGLCLEFAVRICKKFCEAGRVGFAYETLEGHAEKGVSEFYFEEVAGVLRFTIQTYSVPGHWSSRLVARPFSLPYQAWCTRKALKHVKEQFDALNLHTT